MSKYQIDFGDHPVFDPYGFIIPTRMLQKMREEVQGWVWNNATGGYITGAAREGKTFAAIDLCGKIENRSGKILPTIIVSADERDTNSIAAVHKLIAFGSGVTIRSNRAGDEIENTVLLTITEAALKADVKQVLLIVDEAQFLTFKQLKAFCGIHNKIGLKSKLSLVVVFVFNDDLSEEIFSLIKESTRHRYLLRRFFNRKHKFTGICCEDDIRECLSYYDTTRFPKEGGPTYTEFFIPELYQRGWRMEKFSSKFWEIYKNYYGDPQKLSAWGMDSFSATARTFLVDYLRIMVTPDEVVLSRDLSGPSDNADETISGMILSSISQSGIEFSENPSNNHSLRKVRSGNRHV